MNTCPGHGSDALAHELRALALTVLDRTEPLLAAMCSGERPAAPSSCRSCPVCALLAALRGERPELAVRLAEHAAGLLVVLRAVLNHEPDSPPDAKSDARQDSPPESRSGDESGDRPTETPGGRRVQRIPVTRATGPAPRTARAAGHSTERVGRV